MYLKMTPQAVSSSHPTATDTFQMDLCWHFWRFSASGLRLKTVWNLHISSLRALNHLPAFQLGKFWSVQGPASFASFRQVLKFCIKKTQRWWVDSCNPREKALTTKTDKIQHWQSYQHPCRKHKEKSGHPVGKTQGLAWWDNPPFLLAIFPRHCSTLGSDGF